eukprot:366130-Chlamydomonas_euryale.AAC.41
MACRCWPAAWPWRCQALHLDWSMLAGAVRLGDAANPPAVAPRCVCDATCLIVVACAIGCDG